MRRGKTEPRDSNGIHILWDFPLPTLYPVFLKSNSAKDWKTVYLQLYRTLHFLIARICAHLDSIGKFGFRVQSGSQKQMSGRVLLVNTGLGRVLALKWNPFTTMWQCFARKHCLQILGLRMPSFAGNWFCITKRADWYVCLSPLWRRLTSPQM